MNTPDFRTAIIDYVRREARPVEKFSHQPRLYNLTRLIGEGMTYDDDVVFAAAWLHDIGVFLGHRPEDPEALACWDMLGYAIKTVPGILESVGFPQEKTPAVVEAIRTHQPSGTPTTVEGTILRDADLLEQLGATSILRTVCKIGRDTRFSTFDDALAVLSQHLDTLPGQLKLGPTKQLAAARVQHLRRFLEQAAAEGLAPNDPSA